MAKLAEEMPAEQKTEVSPEPKLEVSEPKSEVKPKRKYHKKKPTV
mgnify:FL=1